MLVSGNTGTGKTRIVLTEISKITVDLENPKILIPISFSAQTAVNDLQNQMEGMLTQRLGKNKLGRTRFGPVEYKKGIIFIDDINLPEKEKYMAQPPIELIRQWMDYKGWFDLNSDEKDFNM